jgi:hypothetical protein
VKLTLVRAATAVRNVPEFSGRKEVIGWMP